MAHGDVGEGKWRGNWRMEWVASTLHTTSEHGVSSITTADAHTSAASSRLNWSPPADLNGLVRFAERRNLVSARVPSHFKRCLLSLWFLCYCSVASHVPPFFSHLFIQGDQKLSVHLMITTQKAVAHILSDHPIFLTHSLLSQTNPIINISLVCLTAFL